MIMSRAATFIMESKVSRKPGYTISLAMSISNILQYRGQGFSSAEQVLAWQVLRHEFDAPYQKIKNPVSPKGWVLLLL